VVVTIRDEPRRAELELLWEGGARSRLELPLSRRGPETRRTPEDTVELIRRLAQHHPDRQIAAILSKQGRLTGTGRPFTEARVKAARQRAGIPGRPAARPRRRDRHDRAGRRPTRGVDGDHPPLLADGLLPAEQTTPHAPWRIRLTDQVRRRFAPDVPDGFVPLAEAASVLGVARQTVLHQVQRGERQAIQVTRGRRKGLRIQVSATDVGLFAQSAT